MSSPVRGEWEEIFQDLSGWCIPTFNTVKPVCIADPVDLNTPVIEPGCEELRLNINLAKAGPCFNQEPENDTGVWSPLKESSFLVPWLPKIYPQPFDTEVPPSTINEQANEKHRNKTSKMVQEDQNIFPSQSTILREAFEGSVPEQNSQTKSLMESCVNVEENKNLSTRKLKLKLNVSSNVTLDTNELTTPNIVQMLVATPPLVNNVSQPPDNFEVSNDLMDVDCPDGLLLPLDELGANFDLLAYMMEETPKQEPGTITVETVDSEEKIRDVDKLTCLNSTRCSDSPIDITSQDSTLDVDQPCTSRGRRVKEPALTHMEIILPSKDQVKVELQSDEECVYLSKKRRKRSKSKLSAVPRKRSRRSTSSSSQHTSVSNVSEAGSDNKYRELRDRNNEASKRSRHNRKMRDGEMSLEAVRLEKENRTLKIKADEMERLVKQLRESLLQTITKAK